MKNIEAASNRNQRELLEGYRLLWAAVLATLLTFLGLRYPLFFLAYFVAFWGGFGGISTTARILNTNVLVKYLGMIVACLPLINFVPLTYFLLQARKALKQSDASRPERRSVSRATQHPAGNAPRYKASAGNNVQHNVPQGSNSKQRLAKAIPYVKLAGLSGIADGERLSVGVAQQGVQLTENDEPVLRASKGAFGVFYVVDEGEHLAYITLGEVRAAGLSLDDLHAIGLQNLESLAQNEQPGLKLQTLQNAYGLLLGGHFEASLVLLDELWDGPLKQYTPNGAVAALPARDICAFCDAGSKDGTAELEGIVARVTQGGDHLISDKLFIRKNGSWQEFEGLKPADLPPLEFEL